MCAAAWKNWLFPEFASRMLRGDIPAELQLILLDGPCDQQRDSLLEAEAAIDDITCSTIHGFCQQLIKPYQVEATDVDWKSDVKPTVHAVSRASSPTFTRNSRSSRLRTIWTVETTLQVSGPFMHSCPPDQSDANP